MSADTDATGYLVVAMVAVAGILLLLCAGFFIYLYHKCRPNKPASKPVKADPVMASTYFPSAGRPSSSLPAEQDFHMPQPAKPT
jgi:hypothetical protein